MSAPIPARPARARRAFAGARCALASLCLAWALLSVVPPVAAAAPGEGLPRVLAASSAPEARAVGVHTATAPPAVSVHYEEESLEALEGQLRARAVAEAEFNKVAHHLHLKLRDGRHVLVDYPGHEQPQLQRKLLAAGVPVTIEYTPKSTKATHHTLRYVAAGILVVVLVVLGALLIARRRRLSRLEEARAGGGTQPAPPSPE